MMEVNNLKWLKQIIIYLLLAIISVALTTSHIYILIWLPAGYSIYLMIRGNRFTPIFVFIGGSLSYGAIMMLHKGELSPLFPLITGMMVFGAVEMINGMVGKYFYHRLYNKIVESSGAKLLMLLYRAIILPSILAGGLLIFARFSTSGFNLNIILGQWLALTTTYFLGSSLLLPCLYYYHKEKGHLKELFLKEVRWTELVLLFVALIIGVYLWPNAILVSILMGLLLMPHINATLGSLLVLSICVGMANSLILHTEAIWASNTLWNVYVELFLKVMTVTLGMHLIIGIMQEKHVVVMTLEDVINEKSSKLNICMNRVDELMSFDQLTGTLNRKAFIERGVLEIERTKRYKRHLTLMHIDIDDLKAINEAHGYDLGDTLIAAIAKICEENLRNSDIIARIAGDEFGILMPETTDIDAVLVAEKIQQAVQSYGIDSGSKLVKTTVSIGVTGCIDEMEQCMVSADTALYRAKRKGHNTVMLSSQ